MSEPFGRLRRFLRELKRRKVYRVAAGYLVAAFVVLQLAGLAADAFGFPGWFEPMIWVVAGLALPIAVVLAWAFEVTPEGVRRTPEAEQTAEVAAEADPGLSTGYRILVGLGLVAAAVASGWYLTGGGGETEVTDRSIAVLPFENMGGAESLQFTHGVHDGLLTRLSNISDLQVISRTSVMQYEDTEKTIPQIARELDAAWVVEGAVQQAGGQVQVNAQLIQAKEDVHKWAETYRRKLTTENLFRVQSELTKRIAHSLEAELTPEETERVERRPTEDLDAYQLYVQGRRELARSPQGDLLKAVELFRRAIQRDSTFALAWAGVADAQNILSYYASGGVDTLRRDAREAARRALVLAPDLSEVHASMGVVHFLQRNGPAALRELRRAVELKPSYAQAHQWLGFTYIVLGRREQALEHLQLAERLDPRQVSARSALQDLYLIQGQSERALEEIREQHRRYPELVWPYLDETRALYHLGRLEKAREIARKHLSAANEADVTMGWRNAYLAGIETAYGDSSRARKRLATARENDAPPVVLALAHAAFGDTEATLAAFDSVEDWGYVPTVVARYLPFPDGMNRVRKDSRYDGLIREINRYWGLNPDGSLPDSAGIPPGPPTDD